MHKAHFCRIPIYRMPLVWLIRWSVQRDHRQIHHPRKFQPVTQLMITKRLIKGKHEEIYLIIARKQIQRTRQFQPIYKEQQQNRMLAGIFWGVFQHHQVFNWRVEAQLSFEMNILHLITLKSNLFLLATLSCLKQLTKPNTLLIRTQLMWKDFDVNKLML